MYAVATIQQCVMSEDLSGRTSKAVLFGIVGKRAGQELGAAALRIVFPWLPGSKDATLKEGISKQYDSLLDLKAAVIRVAEENSALRHALAEATEKSKPEIKQVGFANYYYVGDKEPFCQPCYDRTEKLVPVAPQDRYAGGVGR
jgi:hypothetical protein